MSASAARPQRIVVIRAGAVGDTLLTFPTLALLRAWAPAAHLTFVARRDCLPLALASDLASDVSPWDLAAWASLYSDPESVATNAPAATPAPLAGVDIAIVWARHGRTAVGQRLVQAGARRALVAPAFPPPPPPHDSDAAGAAGAASGHMAAWLATALASLGIAPPARAALDTLAAPLATPAWARAEADASWDALGLRGARVVALHPGSGSEGKRWPAERFAGVAALARAAGYMPALLVGEADALALRQTEVALARYGAWGAAAPVARGLSLAATQAWLTRCAGYVGNDSGVSHLAGLSAVPTVAVFGPTDPARWSPLGPFVSALRAADASLASVDAAQAWSALQSLMRR